MSRAQLILSIDQGTTNTKALLLDHAGVVRATSSRPVAITFPQPGWVEQDARALWTSVTAVIDECLAQAGNAEVAAVGLSNQRESAVAWDRRTGEPVGPCVVWQCRRTAGFCDELRGLGLEPLIRERSGLTLDPLFSASKLHWILTHTPDGLARAVTGELCAGNVDSWLLWNLTSGASFATDASNASRTQLMNLATCAWDPELLRIFDIPPACLPRVQASSSIFGVTASCGSLPAGIPVASMIGDSHAALFGHAAFAPGAVKATYGTGSSLMTPIDRAAVSSHGLSTTVAWADAARVRYALEGNITNTGGTVQWLAAFLGLPGGAEEVAALAATVPDSAGAYLVPAFAGLGAPHWDADARGLLCGLTRGTTTAHAARAAVDSIAYQVHDVFEAMRQDADLPIPALFADGGASRNHRLMQFQADILDCPVIRSSSPDLSAIGAAWLAGLATGFWKSLEELESLPRATTRFEPQMPESLRGTLLDGWRNALLRSRSRPVD
ncbi:glycerol kinase GlpK [uncultured Paludibaculum sp.]|uniref:FGGY family carbohydrate kinase n=1 Tax=uncultured Paludibaculum sp. TaxID=1765020 RepID=UPI002AAAE776|nr:glycerol kinase GlpK [uncultured Paludibaculum sp.]